MKTFLMRGYTITKTLVEMEVIAKNEYEAADEVSGIIENMKADGITCQQVLEFNVESFDLPKDIFYCGEDLDYS